MHVHNNVLIKIYSNSFFYSMCWSLRQEFVLLCRMYIVLKNFFPPVKFI